jgi:hypothetical protein
LQWNTKEGRYLKLQEQTSIRPISSRWRLLVLGRCLELQEHVCILEVAKKEELLVDRSA